MNEVQAQVKIPVNKAHENAGNCAEEMYSVLDPHPTRGKKRLSIVYLKRSIKAFV